MYPALKHHASTDASSETCGGACIEERALGSDACIQHKQQQHKQQHKQQHQHGNMRQRTRILVCRAMMAFRFSNTSMGMASMTRRTKDTSSLE